MNSDVRYGMTVSDPGLEELDSTCCLSEYKILLLGNKHYNDAAGYSFQYNTDGHISESTCTL